MSLQTWAATRHSMHMKFEKSFSNMLEWKIIKRKLLEYSVMKGVEFKT